MADINDYGGMAGLPGPNAMPPNAVLPPGPLPAGGALSPEEQQRRMMMAMLLMQMGKGGGGQAGNVAIPQGIGGALNGAMQTAGMMGMMGQKVPGMP